MYDFREGSEYLRQPRSRAQVDGAVEDGDTPAAYGPHFGPREPLAFEVFFIEDLIQIDMFHRVVKGALADEVDYYLGVEGGEPLLRYFGIWITAFFAGQRVLSPREGDELVVKGLLARGVEDGYTLLREFAGDAEQHGGRRQSLNLCPYGGDIGLHLRRQLRGPFLCAADFAELRD